jgi:hypothetical protein
MGEGRYSSTILYLGTRCRSVVSFTPRPLYPRGKNPRYPLDRRLGWPQSRSGRYGNEKKRAPAGNRTPAVEPVAIPRLRLQCMRIRAKIRSDDHVRTFKWGKCYESGHSARVLLVRKRKNLSEQVCRSNEFDFSSEFVRVYIIDNDKLVTLVFENMCLWDMLVLVHSPFQTEFLCFWRETVQEKL